MNNSGLTNHINGTDLSLLIIAVFLSVLTAFVGYRCCRRRRSSGKRKGLQRQIKKVSSRKPQEGEQLCKEASASIDEELNGHSEDKKLVTPSSSPNSSRKTKKSSKHRPHSFSLSPKVDDKNIRNSGDHKKTSWNTPKLAGIWHALFRREDIEGGKHFLQDSSTQETLPMTSSMDKREDNEITKCRSSNSKKESAIKKKSQSNAKRGEEISDVKNTRKQKSSCSCTTTTTANLLGNPHANKKGDKSRIKRASNINEHCAACTGSDCKKCKPHRKTSNANETVSEEEEIVSNQEGSSKELKLVGNNDNLTAEHSGRKDDVKDSPMPQSEDVVMEDIEEKTSDDDYAIVPSPSSPTDSDFVIIEPKNKKVSYGTRASESETKLSLRTDPDLQSSFEVVQRPAGISGHSDGMKEAQPAEIPHGNRIESVGDVFDVFEYASREWKGETSKAEAIRKGYFEVPKQLGLHTIRVVRGDNYCAIRATLFQALAKKIPILPQFEEIQNIPMKLVKEGLDWIMEWNFGTRFHVQGNKVCERMEECLKELYDLVNLNSKMENEEGRVSHLLSSLNYRQEDFDLRLMEAVKFLMLTSAIKLHKSLSCGNDVPVFAMIMFARDTSPDPYHFMKRHLNAVGDTGGLEQVEMYLLGYTLGITIVVVRPSHFGKPDFIASYPDDMPVQTPTVTLVAEDDRHYNILS